MYDKDLQSDFYYDKELMEIGGGGRKPNRSKISNGALTEDQLQFIENMFDQKSMQSINQISSSFNNLHLELIRNFQIQEVLILYYVNLFIE